LLLIHPGLWDTDALEERESLRKGKRKWARKGIQRGEKGCLTLQGNEFARKGKWKESGRFWQSAEFARNGKCKER